MNEADYVKSTTSIREVIERYGTTVNRYNFCSCIFHSEKTASLKIFGDTNSFYCFGCGVGGDIIELVMKAESCDFVAAVKRLGGESVSFTEKRKAANRMQKQRKNVLQREHNKSEYHILFDEWVRLDKNLVLYKPKTANEPLHPLFVEALKNIEYQGHLLDAFRKEW